MKNTGYFLVFVVIAGCAGLPLADKAVRQKTFTLETKVASGTGYHRAIAWLDKHQLPLDGTSMEQLAPEGRIVLWTKSKCQVLGKETDAENRFLTYRMVVEALDNQVKVHFEDVRMVDERGQPLRAVEEQVSSEEQMRKIESCLTQVTKPLHKGIRQLKINWE